MGQTEGVEAIRKAGTEENTENERRSQSQNQRGSQGALGKSEGRRQNEAVRGSESERRKKRWTCENSGCAFVLLLHIKAADSTNEVKLAVGQNYSIDPDFNQPPAIAGNW
jgi:hypothetical protein